MIKIYTDGSCLENPGNGGWAAIINYNGNISFDFSKPDGTHDKSIDISKAKNALGYLPEFKISEGIEKAMPWYINFFKRN